MDISSLIFIFGSIFFLIAAVWAPLRFVKNENIRLALGVFSLFSGLAIFSAPWIWGVWTDNAFILTYLLGVAGFLLGLVFITTAVIRLNSGGVVEALGLLILAVALSTGVVKLAGVDTVIARELAIGQMSVRSPCLPNLEELGIADKRPAQADLTPSNRPSGEEILADQLKVGSGAVDNAAIPVLSGLIVLAWGLWGRRDRQILLALGSGLASAVLLSGYIYWRGPIAWCGQLVGWDSLILAVMGGAVLVHLLSRHLSKS